MQYLWIHSIRCNIMGILFACIVVCTAVTPVYAQGNISTHNSEITTASNAEPTSPLWRISIQPVRMDSPRDTFITFQRITRELEAALLVYWKKQNRENASRITFLLLQFGQLTDLSSVPKASRLKAASDMIASLLDIMGRIDPPSSENIPSTRAFFDDETLEKWRIPETPITIDRVKEGPREGEFLFGPRTVTVAKTFYQQIQHLPLRSTIGLTSWHHTLSQLHGPMIPLGFVSALPDRLKHIWLDTAVWKILIVIIVSVLAIFLLYLWRRIINLWVPKSRIGVRFNRLFLPMAIILVVLILKAFFSSEVIVLGAFAEIVFFATTLVISFTVVWGFWLLIMMFFEWIIILSPKILDKSLDANLLRLCARFIAIVGGMLILAHGAQDIGIPVLGVMAGLGVGGLGVALAIRPTMENLISGLVLYADRPVRIGDYCNFGSHAGTVESIGMRSTQIRALDRTLISVPNATFADMKIINWAQCDMMLIRTMVGLRYETDPDQLRYVLAKIREMFHAHPKIDRDTIRVRFVGYGASSLDVEIRVYALAREWNEFYAIREDVLLRVNEIVNESGTSFAFPSQTVYMGRDRGLDKDRSDEALNKVDSWRRSGQLPFPKLSASKKEQLEDTLDYPPVGSPDAISSKKRSTEVSESLSAEPLSAEPKNKDSGKAKKQAEPERQ